MEFLYQLYSGHSIQVFEGFNDKLVEIGFDGFELELIPQDAQAADVHD